MESSQDHRKLLLLCFLLPITITIQFLQTKNRNFIQWIIYQKIWTELIHTFYQIFDAYGFDYNGTIDGQQYTRNLFRFNKQKTLHIISGSSYVNVSLGKSKWEWTTTQELPNVAFIILFTFPFIPFVTFIIAAEQDIISNSKHLFSAYFFVLL